MTPIIIGTIASSFVSGGVIPPVAFTPSFRYWRMAFLDGDNSTYLSLAEVDMRAVAGGPSIATGGTAFSNHADRGGSWVIANAFDGNDNSFTSWQSKPFPVTLGYDFGTPVTVVEIMIRARPTFQNHAPTIFRLEASHDNQTYHFMGMGQQLFDWTGGEEEVFTVIPPDFDTSHQRVGFANDDTEQCYGNQLKSLHPFTLTGLRSRPGLSSRNWTINVYRTTSLGRIKELADSHTVVSPTINSYHPSTLSAPVEIAKGEHFAVLYRENNGAWISLNDLTLGNFPVIAEATADTWMKTADVFPVIGEEPETTVLDGGRTGYVSNLVGTYEVKDPEPDWTGKTAVIWIGGQSNSIGRGSDLTAIDTTPVANVLMVDDTETSIVDAVEPVSHGGNQNLLNGGYNFALGREFMTRYNPDRVILVGVGKGGTGIADGEWAASGGYSAYPEAKTRWAAAWSLITASYPDAEVAMMVWTQGEDECQNFTTEFDGTDDDLRFNNMTTTVHNIIRKTWGNGLTDQTPIVYTPIPAASGFTGLASYTNIQTAIANHHDHIHRSGFMDISGITQTFEDTVHWDVACARQFGPVLVDAYERARHNEFVPDNTADIDIADPSRSALQIGLDARGLRDGAIIEANGLYKEFDCDRVMVKDQAMQFDGIAEMRWRHPSVGNGKPVLAANDFSIKCGIIVTASTEGGIFSDYNTTGNQRSFVLRSNSGAFQFYGSDTGTAATLMLTFTRALDTYYDLEIRRVGTLLEMIVDGVVQDTHTLAGGYSFFQTTSENLHIGDHINAREFTGSMSYFSLEFL